MPNSREHSAGIGAPVQLHHIPPLRENSGRYLGPAAPAGPSDYTNSENVGGSYERGSPGPPATLLQLGGGVNEQRYSASKNSVGGGVDHSSASTATGSEGLARRSDGGLTSPENTLIVFDW